MSPPTLGTVDALVAPMPVISVIGAVDKVSIDIHSEGRVQKIKLGKLEDFSIKWVDGVLLVH